VKPGARDTVVSSQEDKANVTWQSEGEETFFFKGEE
jgi:hypothetical protein